MRDVNEQLLLRAIWALSPFVHLPRKSARCVMELPHLAMESRGRKQQHLHHLSWGLPLGTLYLMLGGC